MTKTLICIFICLSAYSTSMPAPGAYPLPSNTQPASSARCMAMLPQCMGNTSSAMPGDHCIHCQSMGNQMWGFNMIQPSYPWWYNYGRYNYQNFAYPGAYYNGGLSHHYYPGPGNMAAGKPNLYFHGLEDVKTDIRFELEFSKESNLLAASPIHEESGWIFKSEANKIRIAQAKYDYIYYDYKLDSSKLQSSKGFCGQKSLVYSKMVRVLNDMKFKEKEVKDFEDYWSIKLPKGNFCVYPQSHKELNEIAKWKSSIMPAHFRRVLFVVIPREKMTDKKFTHFSQVPQTDWNPLSGVYRVPASKEKFQVHEWGVAFMVSNTRK